MKARDAYVLVPREQTIVLRPRFDPTLPRACVCGQAAVAATYGRPLCHDCTWAWDAVAVYKHRHQQRRRIGLLAYLAGLLVVAWSLTVWMFVEKIGWS